MKKYTWGTIVPLIGGQTVAGKQVTGTDPDFLLSYTPFADNERNVTAYFPKVPYHFLDEKDNGGFNVKAYQDVDFVSALCPCAGLSMLSRGGEQQRAGMNKWLLESARFVTGQLRPKVFWGENAPALYKGGLGELVRHELRQVARDNGYSFSLYFTNTLYHGIPQSRKRTFYFFWRGDQVPILNYYRRPHKGLKEYLLEVPDGISGQMPEDKQALTERLNQSTAFMFLQDKYQGAGIQAFRDYPITGNKICLTLLQYLIDSNQVTENRDWCKARNMENSIKYWSKLCDKVAAGQGFWDGSPPKFRDDGYFSALVSKNSEALHPTEDRYITQRECMHLMGLPHDFQLVTGALNHVFQNVPVCTSADMHREVIGFIEGERELANVSFMQQSNQTRRIDQCESLLLNF